MFNECLFIVKSKSVFLAFGSEKVSYKYVPELNFS